MEKYATIEKILEISPHENSDNLLIAKILGYQVIIKKDDNYKVGDWVCYVKTDTVVSDQIPEFAFLKERKYRIKAIKLRGKISEGIVFPMSIVDKYNMDMSDYLMQEGWDISGRIGVKHYEKPMPVSLSGQAEGSFPTNIISKTDEVRLASEPTLLNEFNGKECYVSCKCDGTSATYINKDGQTKVCSRNLEMKDTEANTYWKIGRESGVITAIEKIGNIAVQGEICGQGIQKNPMNLHGLHLFIFNIKDLTNDRYYTYDEMVKFCNYNNLKMVPIIDDHFIFNHTMEQLVELSKGKYPDTQNEREGIVIRPKEINVYSETLRSKLSVKVINPNYKDDE